MVPSNASDRFINASAALVEGRLDIPEDSDDRTDRQSLERVARRLLAAAAGFRVKLFENKCSLDLHIYRDSPEHPFNERTALEAKEADWAIGSNHPKFVGGTRCKGAFIPKHKVQSLGMSQRAGFHHQFFAYMFVDDPEVYFIPLDVIWDKWVEEEHPLEPELIRQNRQDVIWREGRRVLRVDEVQKWRGTAPMLAFMEKINSTYLTKCV